MKRFLYIFILVATLSACTADFEGKDVVVGENNYSAKIVNGSQGCVEGSMILCFDSSAESRLAEGVTRSGATRTGLVEVDAILDRVNGCRVEPVFVMNDKNRNKVKAMGLHLWYEVFFDAESDIEGVAADFARVAEVSLVQYVHRVCRLNNPKVVSSVPVQELIETRTSDDEIPFNDIYRLYQWGLCNLGPKSKVKTNDKVQGMTAAIVEADINAVPAWRLCTGDPSIVVAILDEGVMYTHEDLAANMWKNNSELNGKSNTDDDGNGYKDDAHGFNFVSMGEIVWGESGDTGHGTHVAGIVSAVNNNGLGICSIAGGSGNNDGVKLMPLQIFQGNKGATTSNIAKAMQYAADNGAQILQNSWGYVSAEAEGYRPNQLGPGNDAGYRYLWPAEVRAIEYFIANAGGEDSPIDGGLVIFAAGNDTATIPGYPGAFEPCISVAAYGPALRPTYYTDHGIGTDIVAPGGESLYDMGDILSTVPDKNATHGTKHYTFMQGTSQACPHVSGVAALGLSYAKKLGKRYTAKEFRSMLLSSTHDIDPYLEGAISFRDVNGFMYNIDYTSYIGKLGAGYIDASLRSITPPR